MATKGVIYIVYFKYKDEVLSDLRKRTERIHE